MGFGDAVVLGGALYAGRWHKAARRFARRHGRDLRARPVWLFSSGPLGDHPAADPQHLAELRDAVSAVDHRTFFGALDRERLNLGERLVTKAVHAPYGDFRDWAEIDAWTAAIADQLRTATEQATP